ncbi:MAG: ABC transporter ATP-binding protein [Candidatus Velthaea sp.]|jgi:NitT/TauT family transport system ATP-binding protein
MQQKTLFDTAHGVLAHTVLDVKQVGMTYGSRDVMRDITFSVTQGDFISIVGPSGCGKTTLLRAMAGLTVPTSGSIRFKDREIRGPQAEVAVVFQDYNRALLPWRTVSGNVALALEARRIPRAEQAARVAELLQRVGLAQHAGHYPGQLSGGLQQRVQIARALAQEPEVLLMDEPFGALDAITRQRLQDQILAIWQTTPTTIVFITHDLEEAIYLGDRIIVLESGPGRIAADIRVELARPRHQLSTREDGRFLEIRHRLFGLLSAE